MTRRTFLLLAVPSIGCLLVGLVAVLVSRSAPVASPTLADGLRAIETRDAMAVERIASSLQAAGSKDEARFLRASWLSSRGRFIQAMQLLTPSMFEGPLKPEALLLAGQSLFELKEFEQAEAVLKRLTTDFPDDVAAHRLLAVIYFDLRSHTLTMTELRHVQRLDPTDYRPHHLAGVILSDDERFQDAIEQFQMALTKQPALEVRTTIRHALAQALMRNRDYRGAIAILTAEPVPSESEALLAECQLSLGDADAAGVIADRLLESHPDLITAMKVKARLWEDAGEVTHAIELMERVVVAEPFDVESRHRLAVLYGAAGQKEAHVSAQAEYLRVYNLHTRLVELNVQADADSDAVAPRRELSEVCQALGRTELAQVWQQAADRCERRVKLNAATPLHLGK